VLILWQIWVKENVLSVSNMNVVPDFVVMRIDKEVCFRV